MPSFAFRSTKFALRLASVLTKADVRLHDAEVIEGVVAALDTLAPDVPLVADPVMVAKGGAALLADDAVATLRDRLCPRATLLTPNVPEAEALTGRTVSRDAELDDSLRQFRRRDPHLRADGGRRLRRNGHRHGGR